jgi:hypothetical protein
VDLRFLLPAYRHKCINPQVCCRAGVWLHRCFSLFFCFACKCRSFRFYVNHRSFLNEVFSTRGCLSKHGDSGSYPPVRADCIQFYSPLPVDNHIFTIVEISMFSSVKHIFSNKVIHSFIRSVWGKTNRISHNAASIPLIG